MDGGQQLERIFKLMTVDDFKGGEGLSHKMLQYIDCVSTRVTEAT